MEEVGKSSESKKSFEFDERALSPIVKCKEIQSLVNVGLSDNKEEELSEGLEKSIKVEEK